MKQRSEYVVQGSRFCKDAKSFVKVQGKSGRRTETSFPQHLDVLCKVRPFVVEHPLGRELKRHERFVTCRASAIELDPSRRDDFGSTIDGCVAGSGARERWTGWRRRCAFEEVKEGRAGFGWEGAYGEEIVLGVDANGGERLTLYWDSARAIRGCREMHTPMKAGQSDEGEVSSRGGEAARTSSRGERKTSAMAREIDRCPLNLTSGLSGGDRSSPALRSLVRERERRRDRLPLRLRVMLRLCLGESLPSLSVVGEGGD